MDRLNAANSARSASVASATEGGTNLSPGNTGWNQARVQWASDRPENSGKYHFDNMLVLVINETGLTEGDMISFTSSSISEDPNRNDTKGGK